MKGILAYLIISTYLYWEVFYLYKEVSGSYSKSPIGHIIFIIKSSRWYKNLSLGFDPSGTFAHSLVLVVVSSLLLFFSRGLGTWLYIHVILIQLILLILLVDQLFWVRSSVKVYFNRLYGRVKAFESLSAFTKEKKETAENVLGEIKKEVQQFSQASYAPYFVSRFFLVVIFSVYIYATIYYSINLISSGSFTSLEMPFSFLDSLYYSAAVATGINMSLEPQFWVAKIFVSIHGFVNLYLLVLVIAFFASISEREVDSEKTRLLSSIDNAMKTK